MQPLTRKIYYTLSESGLVVLLVAGLTACRMGGVSVQTVKTDKATARLIMTPRNIVNPNTDGESQLVVGGKTFTNLRGSPPFYIDVPGSKRILFVTHPNHNPYEATLHVFDLETKTDICVDVTKAGFGWHIGSDRKPGEKLSDFIESAQSERITIATRSLDLENTFVINLSSKSIERVETFYYDAEGHITNSVVREGGPEKWR